MKTLRIILLALFVLGGLLYLNSIIPAPQKTQATTWQQSKGILAQEYPCASGNTVVLHVADEETPDCKNGALSDLTSYQGGVTVSLKNTNNWYRIHSSWGSYYCPELGGPCLLNKQLTQNTYVIKPGDYTHITANTNNNVQKMCGNIQDDLAFTADVSTNQGQTWTAACGYGTNFNDPGQNATTATWCSTGVKCSSITPTPSVTVTPPVTPSVTPPVQSHLACQNFACVKMSGPGDNSCTTEASISSECSHLTCLNNTCTRTNGAGDNSCTTEGSSCNIPPTAHLTVIKQVENNHGGTKTATDFTLRVNGNQVITGVTNTENPGDYTVSEDSMDGYHQTSISGSCDSNGHVHLTAGDNATCIIENQDNGGGSCTMPSCTTNISGCSFPFPDTNSCSCGPLVCITQVPGQNNITINNNNTQSQNQQQQQQQAVLGASVAPAVSSSSLPSTGAGADVLLTLAGLLPVGFKLRKLV